MTITQARELSRLSNQHFYVLIRFPPENGWESEAVYECWPGGRCVRYGLEIQQFNRYKVRAKACEKQVLSLQLKYQKHLEAFPLSADGGE